MIRNEKMNVMNEEKSFCVGLFYRIIEFCFLGQISFRELKYLCFLLVVFRFHNFSYLDKIVKIGLSFFV